MPRTAPYDRSAPPPYDPPPYDPPQSPGRRWGRWAAGTVSLAVLATSGGGWAVLHGIGDSIGRVDAFDGDRGRPTDDGMTTFLVVGTDDRDGIPEHTLKNVLHAGGESCHCTDTMMVVQLADDGGRASVVSIPRDSYVDIPAHQDPATGRQVPAGKGKINAAYGMGGAPLTVRTVEQNTGLRIDHYLQVNFLGFVAAVDALGGVEVCTTKPLKDDYSGLDLPAGTTRLDGAGALKYVRARHVDGTSDLGRMHRQQRLLAQLLHQAASGGLLLDPARLAGVANSVLASVKADKDLSSGDLLSLATRLKDLSASNADFATVPLADLDYQAPGWGSAVKWDEKGAKALFEAVRQGRPLTGRPAGSGGTEGANGGAGSAAGAAASPMAAGTVAPGQIRVQVLNGTGVQGLGSRVDSDLRKAGFATTGTPSNAAGAPSPHPGSGTPSAVRTVVRYDPRWDESVKTLAAALPGAELVAVSGLGATLEVVAGTDYRGVAGVAGSAPTGTPTAAVSASGAAVVAETGAAIGCSS
ncbi:LCP family protein [Kitasatospora paracochleata]|uniref:LCP family protein required for cell wall assembly n=1 Tax=Kitasatospora paracochleata TaxID=58354 RepID=A0ABT1IY12_9ACTN|nr:LCP family protein [Kitasatospora paracochleata]MCP2310023.1 LCP family protein required for cell wall assembly [Kitasatospora paracochleata]